VIFLLICGFIALADCRIRRRHAAAGDLER
jgi:hypothetical protein